MKKHILFIVLAASLAAGTLQAQDTIQIRDMRLINRYYVPEWVDTFIYYPDYGVHEGNVQFWGENLEQAKEDAYKMYTDDTLMVYGIAACLTTMWRMFPDDYESVIQSGLMDSSCEYMYDYLRLYEAAPNSLVHIGDELLVNLRYTPVSYYIDLKLLRGFLGNVGSLTMTFWPILPMYERYFSEPVSVVDSFYVGRRSRLNHRDNRKIVLAYLADTSVNGREYRAAYYDYIAIDPFGKEDTVQMWSYWSNPRISFPFLFPILTPPDSTVNMSDTIIIAGDTIVIPGDTIVYTGDTIITPGDTTIIGGDTIINPGDTIVNPGDTLAIRTNDILYRYTALQPNPATDKVKVLSSFGITRIEAYDLKGRKVSEFRTPNSEFSITLDVSSWPRGTYLLRITTPAGQTTKKLLLR